MYNGSLATTEGVTMEMFGEMKSYVCTLDNTYSFDTRKFSHCFHQMVFPSQTGPDHIYRAP